MACISKPGITRESNKKILISSVNFKPWAHYTRCQVYRSYLEYYGTYSRVSFKQMFWLLFSASPWPFRLCCLFITSAARLLTCIWQITIFSYKQPEVKRHFYGFRATTRKKNKRKKKLVQWHSMAFLRHARRVAPMHSNHWGEKHNIIVLGKSQGEDLGVCMERI